MGFPSEEGRMIRSNDDDAGCEIPHGSGCSQEQRKPV